MEIQNGYEVFLRGIDQYKVSSVRPGDFLNWFHLAQQDYVDQRLEFFELTGQYDDDITVILSEKTYSSPSIVDKLDVPEDYFRTASLIVNFSYKNDCDETIDTTKKITRMTGNNKGLILSNIYYKPNRDRWYYRKISDKIKIYGDSTVTISSIDMEYVITLPEYTTTDLTDNTDTIWTKDQQDKISNKAAMLFLENKESQRVRTFAQVNKIDQV